MAILRGGRRIGNYDIRIGLPRDKSLVDVAGDPRLKRKPGGHNFYKEIISDSLNSSYCENLKKLGQTDTLIAIAK